MKPLWGACLAILIAGSAVTPAAYARPDPAQICDNAAGQRFIGSPATAQTGAQIMAATGAMIFEWIFEGQGFTKDLRQERVRVIYNRDMKIIAVTCG